MDAENECVFVVELCVSFIFKDIWHGGREYERTEGKNVEEGLNHLTV